MPTAFLIILASYLIGAIPVAYLAGRLKGVDIRRLGSRNVGASNVYQMVSRRAVVPVGLAQIALGMAGILLAKLLDEDTGVQVAAGVAALVGAAWSIYIGFAGGRGIGASIGFLLALTPPALVVFIIVSLLGVALRQVPVGVGIGIALSPLSALIAGESGAVVAGCLCLATIVFSKRLLGEGLPRAGDWREVLLNRLLFDRDVRDRDAWVRRDLDGHGHRA